MDGIPRGFFWAADSKLLSGRSIVEFSEGWCDPFDCNHPAYVAVIWASRLLVVTGVAWIAYRVVRRRLMARHELAWLAGSAMLAIVSCYRSPVHGYAPAPFLTVLFYALAAGIRMVFSVFGLRTG